MTAHARASRGAMSRTGRSAMKAQEPRAGYPSVRRWTSPAHTSADTACEVNDAERDSEAILRLLREAESDDRVIVAAEAIVAALPELEGALVSELRSLRQAIAGP